MAAQPMVISGDGRLLDDLGRLAAAAGVELERRSGPPPRGPWRSASLILIDVEQVPAAVAAGLPRRDGVLAVATAEPDTRLWEQCVLLGVERTVITAQADEILVDALAATAAAGVGDGCAIAVLGACGGVGASVIAAATAVAAHRGGRRTLLVDCDQWGCGLDVVLGVEAEHGVSWTDLAAPSGRLPPDALRRALPGMATARGQIPVLGFGTGEPREVPLSVAEVVVNSTRRAGDLSVVDLPRAPTPAGDRVAELADLTVLVVPADVRGCYAARRQLRHLTDLGARPGLVVRGPSPGGIGADDVGAALDLPVLAYLRPQARLARELDNGRPPGADPKSPLGRAAAAILTAAERVSV